MPASLVPTQRFDAVPAARTVRGPSGLTLADSNPSPVRWRRTVGWLRKV